MKLHPDKNPVANSFDRYQQIVTAYEVLRDPERREWYDLTGRIGTHILIQMEDPLPSRHPELKTESRANWMTYSSLILKEKGRQAGTINRGMNSGSTLMS